MATPKSESAVVQVPEERKIDSSTFLWVNTTYFTQGLPYSIVRLLTSVYFTDIGAKERYIGYLNFLGIPWNFKFLWAPFVDAISTKRRWLVVMQLLISLLVTAVAVTNYLIPAGAEPSNYLVFIASIFIGMAFIAATNDIAIDGYYMEGIPDKGEQAAYSGYRVMAWRIGMIFVRSGMVAVAAIAASRVGAENKFLQWAYAFGAGALAMFLLTLFHEIKLPRVEKERESRSPKEVLDTYGRAFRSYLQQEKVALVLLFITIYKIGDEILFSMVSPFLLRELGISKAQFSWIAGIVGAAGVVVGAMIGGWWIKKTGLKKAIWPLTLLMNLNIWAYIWLAYSKPDPNTIAGIATIAFVHGYEQVAAGLGSAVLLVYLLRTCNPEFKAAHYAIGSAIMSLPATFVGGFGGRLVESMGYLNLFILAFFASIPSMLLIFWVPIKEEKKS